MKAVLHTLVVTLTLHFLGRGRAEAQPDSLANQRMAQFVQKAVNEGNSKAIYDVASHNFRQKMTEAQFSTGMKKFRIKTGVWLASTVKAQTTQGVDYTADFELGQQLFSLTLDDEGKIDRMNFSAAPVTIRPKSEPEPSNNALRSKLDTAVERLVRPYIQKGNTVGLVLAILDRGKVYKYSYGRVDKRGREQPTSSTIFEIGSVTKTFTSLLLAQEVIAGRMGLGDPINTYLPDSIPFIGLENNPVKLVHLATHTAGFPRLPENIFTGDVNPKNPYQHYSLDLLYSFLVHYRVTTPPGQTFSYSNYGAGLLGTLIANQLGVEYGKLVETRICRSLKMTHTFVDLPARLPNKVAQGYNEQGLATSAWDLASLQGSGAIRSSLDDMVLYVKAQLGAKNALHQAIELSQVPAFTSSEQVMGLGWRINKLNQQAYYYHSGGTGGFRSYLGFDKTRQVAVIILSNAADEVTELGEQLLRVE